MAVYPEVTATKHFLLRSDNADVCSGFPSGRLAVGSALRLPHRFATERPPFSARSGSAGDFSLKGRVGVAYEFVGFLARPTVTRPESLPDGAVWREITAPFVGVGVRLPTSFNRNALPAPDAVQVLARSLGVIAANRWLYLDYVCWGGDIDSVYGLGSRDGVPFGPVEESNLDRVKAVYVGLMGHLGITEAEALRFEPFTRGYWGED
jgi:hypothetical protein